MVANRSAGEWRQVNRGPHDPDVRKKDFDVHCICGNLWPCWQVIEAVRQHSMASGETKS